jgi:SAM-dependent methyltransferase
VGLFLKGWNPMHGTENPSAWLQRWAHLIPRHSRVLDVACGAGRHMRWLAAQGHTVQGVDRHPEAVALAQAYGDVTCADIENGPWPFAGQTFDCLVVTHYLWRPLWPNLLQSVAPGGLLIYETFAAGNESVGKPSRPDFLLQPGELLQATHGLRTIAYEDGFESAPDRFMQRIVAVKPVPSATPLRFPLSAN